MSSQASVIKELYLTFMQHADWNALRETLSHLAPGAPLISMLIGGNGKIRFLAQLPSIFHGSILKGKHSFVDRWGSKTSSSKERFLQKSGQAQGVLQPLEKASRIATKN